MDTRTIMIFPEFENINIIEKIRKKYDPLYNLVRPHITIVFPFQNELTNTELKLYLNEVLKNVFSFEIEMQGFSKQTDIHGNYLFLNVTKGIEKINNINNLLYKDKSKKFGIVHHYVPHMTVGRLASKELLFSAFEEIKKHNIKFKTIVNKISVELIGEKQESIIIIEKELK